MPERVDEREPGGGGHLRRPRRRLQHRRNHHRQAGGRKLLAPISPLSSASCLGYLLSSRGVRIDPYRRGRPLDFIRLLGLAPQSVRVLGGRFDAGGLFPFLWATIHVCFALENLCPATAEIASTGF